MSVDDPEEQEGFYYVRVRRTYINDYVVECYAKNEAEALRDAKESAASERLACWQQVGTQETKVSVKLDPISTELQGKQT